MRTHADNGFAIIDTLVALFVLSLGATSLLLLQILSTELSENSLRRSEAIQIASELLEGPQQYISEQRVIHNRMYQVDLQSEVTAARSHPQLSLIQKNLTISWESDGEHQLVLTRAIIEARQ